MFAHTEAQAALWVLLNKYAPMSLNTHTDVQSLKLLAKLPCGNGKYFRLKTQTQLYPMKKKKLLDWKSYDYEPKNDDYFCRENIDIRVQTGKTEGSQGNGLF